MSVGRVLLPVDNKLHHLFLCLPFPQDFKWQSCVADGILGTRTIRHLDSLAHFALEKEIKQGHRAEKSVVGMAFLCSIRTAWIVMSSSKASRTFPKDLLLDGVFCLPTTQEEIMYPPPPLGGGGGRFEARHGRFLYTSNPPRGGGGVGGV